MTTISVCMIVKNEEDVLDRALRSVQDIADEIIIVDTGSTDRTKKIAEKYTDQVYDFVWCNDFSKARNYSFSKATKDYCMWLDADDVILDKDREGLLELKKTLPEDTSVVMMKYNTGFDDAGKPTFTYYRERLLRRIDNFRWGGFVHEAILPRGKIIYSDVAISHKKIKQSNPKRNLQIFRSKLKEGAVFTPREIFYYARELYYHRQYDEAIMEFKHFLNTKKGWVENNISACQFLGYCYHQLGNMQEAVSWLLNSMRYDLPRAEVCCDLGKYFLEMRSYEQAIYWYAVAMSCKRDDTSGAFVLPDCYDYIPSIQICLCYDTLGDYETANFYNELAGQAKPDSQAYLQNKRYFERRLKNKE
ncbi:MAG: glycosyltransferase [Beduini sp.]|uniref:glycosyltransferase n=1 Tax=Beduini sp. TaxID=1922300 RepID=UPI0011CC404F